MVRFGISVETFHLIYILEGHLDGIFNFTFRTSAESVIKKLTSDSDSMAQTTTDTT